MANNPLSYIDPDGREPITLAALGILIIKGAAIGAAIGGVSYTAAVGFSKGGFNNWNWGQFGKSVGLGAAGGAVSAGIGSAAGAIGGVGGYAFQTAAHGAWGGLNSMWNGGDFWSGALSGAAGNVVGGLTAGLKPGLRIGASALMGGVSSELAGGNFWRGAATGATVAGANHLLHQVQQQMRSGNRIEFDGKHIRVYSADGELLYVDQATSGKGEHMNQPSSQNIQDLGPIPEGSYSFSGKDWKYMSPITQLKRLILGGDWGFYNVKLNPVTYKGARHSFYIHGGSYPGSAGCIDIGRGVVFVRNLTHTQNKVTVYVKYSK